MEQDTGGISGFRGFAVEPSGLAPPGINPGRKDFTIADVLAWARTKPADETYDYTNSGSCALAQFGEATGRPELTGCDGTDFLEAHDELRDAFCSSGRVDTFGRLVRKLEKLCPETPKSDWLAIDAYMAGEQVSA